ncbi:hypothetical protein CEXT_231161, partial [Caerostris extrusa]
DKSDFVPNVIAPSLYIITNDNHLFSESNLMEESMSYNTPSRASHHHPPFERTVGEFSSDLLFVI